MKKWKNELVLYLLLTVRIFPAPPTALGSLLLLNVPIRQAPTLLPMYINTNEYFTDDLLIKIYGVPNLLLDDEPILKNVMGWDTHWKEVRRLTHRNLKKKKRSKSGKREGNIRTVNKRERTNSFFHFFMWAWFHFQVNRFSFFSSLDRCLSHPPRCPPLLDLCLFLTSLYIKLPPSFKYIFHPVMFLSMGSSSNSRLGTSYI